MKSFVLAEAFEIWRVSTHRVLPLPEMRATAPRCFWTGYPAFRRKNPRLQKSAINIQF